jgi:hypothetical protein
LWVQLPMFVWELVLAFRFYQKYTLYERLPSLYVNDVYSYYCVVPHCNYLVMKGPFVIFKCDGCKMIGTPNELVDCSPTRCSEYSYKG